MPSSAATASQVPSLRSSATRAVGELRLQGRPHPSDLDRSRPEQGVEDVLGAADHQRTPGEELVRALRRSRCHRSRDGTDVAAELLGDVGGDQRPRALRSLDDDGELGQRRHDPVAGREGPAPRPRPRRQLRQHRSPFEQAPVQAAVRRRVGNVGPASEHGDRRAGVDGAAVGGGVDPEGHAADDDQARDRELIAEAPRHLAPVSGRPPRPDDGDGFLGQISRQQAPVADSDQGSRGVRGDREGAGVGVVVSAAGPAPGRRELGPHAGLSDPVDLGAQPLRVLGRHRLRQPIVVEPQQLRRARARRSGRDSLHVGRQPGQEPGPSQTGPAGARLTHPLSRRRRCSACAIASAPISASASRSAIVRASRSARSWARPLSPSRA